MAMAGNNSIHGEASGVSPMGQKATMKNTVWLICCGLILGACGSDDDCDPVKSVCARDGGTPDSGADGAIDSSADSVAIADAPAPDAAPLVCPAPSGVLIKHGSDITTNETWAGDGIVHQWVFSGTIRPGATLTLAPCAVVQVNPGLSITMRGATNNPARLVAMGTATQPVLITNVPGSAKWGNISNFDADSTVDLAYTTLQNGGNGTFHGSTIDLKGGGDPGTMVIPVLRAVDVVVKNSAGTGLVMENAAAFSADSTQVTVTGGGTTPGGGDSAIEINQLAAGTLPRLHISANAIDQIRVSAGPGSQVIARDLTLKNLGVPYYFYFDRVRVADPLGVVVPTLTIQPGVEVRFDDYLMVGDTTAGKLVAIGTSAMPVTFTSSKPTRKAGDWPGIWLRNASGSRIEHARIDYAGGFNGISSANCKPAGTVDHAALFLGGFGSAYLPQPSELQSITVANSASHGINAMWTAADFGPDLTSGFMFIGINGCKQTKNSRPTGCGAQPNCLVP